MPQKLPLAITCIACKDSLSAYSLELFTKDRVGIYDTKQCFTLTDVEKLKELKLPIILVLDENFTGNHSTISDIKNFVASVNPIATHLHCNDQSPERLQSLLELGFDAYTLKTQPCDFVRQAFTLLLKGIKFTDHLILEKTKHLKGDTILYHGIQFKILEYKIILLKMDGVKPSAIPARIGIKTLHIYNDNRNSATLKVKQAGYNDLKHFIKKVQESEKV